MKEGGGGGVRREEEGKGGEKGRGRWPGEELGAYDGLCRMKRAKRAGEGTDLACVLGAVPDGDARGCCWRC